jgi:hypothetical protein
MGLWTGGYAAEEEAAGEVGCCAHGAPGPKMGPWAGGHASEEAAGEGGCCAHVEGKEREGEWQEKEG